MLVKSEARKMWILAAATLDRDVLLHGLTDDEQRVMIGAVLNAVERTQLDELRAALVETLPLLEGERAVMRDSYTELSGRYKGQVIDKDAKQIIDRMGAAIDRARKALGATSHE